MNTTFKTYASIFLITVPLLFLAETLQAQFVYPPVYPAFPNNNTEALIHVGADQVKGNTTNSSGLAVGAFVAKQNASLDGQSFFTGHLNGLFLSTVPGGVGFFPNTTHFSMLRFGGTISGDPQPKKATIDINGKLSSLYGLSSGMLASTESETELCAEQDGTIILCSDALWEPIYVVVNETFTPAENHYQCIDSNGDPIGYTVQDGQEHVTVTLEFYRSQTDYQNSGNFFVCGFSQCKFDVTGRNLVIKYAFNGTQQQTPALAGMSHVLFSNLPTDRIVGDVYNCSVEATPVNTYTIQNGTALPVPYQLNP